MRDAICADRGRTAKFANDALSLSIDWQIGLGPRRGQMSYIPWSPEKSETEGGVDMTTAQPRPAKLPDTSSRRDRRRRLRRARAGPSACRAPVRITLIDRRNHHLFQPLLYQVATASCRRPRSPGRSAISAHVRGHHPAGQGHRHRSRRAACARTAARFPTTSWWSPPARGTPISATTNGSRSRPA